MRILRLAELHADMTFLILLLLCASIIRAFDSRLSLGAALDTSDKTMKNEFPASVGEQLHLTHFPLQIYGKEVVQIKIYANGFVVLGNHSLEVPSNYPSQTAYSKQRLSEMSGDFIGVFTTVNQCSPNGKIIIRELDVNEVESDSCTFHHVLRIGDIISTAAPDDPFEADYILTITWKDMGCVPSSQPLMNTFTLALVRMEQKTYAVFQYDEIQWTADHSTSSLPPEAGIFIHGIETPQLPRNNMHIDPNVWNEESNIAVPGEWLFPLFDGPIDVDVAAQSTIRMSTEDFVENSIGICEDMVSLKPKPIPTLPGYYAESSANTDSSEILSATSTSDAESFTSDYLSSYTASKIMLPTDESTSASIYTPTELSPAGYTSDISSASNVAVSLPTLSTTLKETSEYSTTLVKSSYDDSEPASSEAFLERDFQKCDNSVCKDSISKCLVFGGRDCCICPSGYYGGGPEGCHLVNPTEPRRIYLEGEMIIDLSGSDGQQPLTAPIFLDTEVRTGESLLSQAGIHRSPQKFPLIHAIVPIFSILNTFLAIPKDSTGGLIDTHTFNIFSLTSGFSSAFNFTFYINVDRSGRIILRGSLKRLSSSETTFRGSLDVQVTSDGSFSPLSTPLVGSDGLIQTENRMDQSIEFEKISTGRVQFSSQIFNIKAASGQPVSVQISGYGEADVREGACLLDEESLIRHGQRYAVSLGSQGYCREDCRADYGCSLYCVDMPYFTGTESDLCASVRCGRNAHCKGGHCYCNEGHEGDPNSACQRAPEPAFGGDICDLPTEVGPCQAYVQRFTYNRSANRCEMFYYGGCEGNANNFERIEDCHQRCESSRQEAIPCKDVRCGAYAYCVEGRCVCPQGFEGDPLVECREAYGDPCRETRCGYNAHCVEGRCDCDEGYSGDPYNQCHWMANSSEDVCNQPADTGPCRAFIQRYAFNRSSGRCEMFTYGGCRGNNNNFERIEDCQRYCEPSSTLDPCADVRCGSNAYCLRGYCYCKEGYEGDANTGCQPFPAPVENDPCEGVRCGYQARCRNGRCECVEGYSGDPYRECKYQEGQGDPCQLPPSRGPCQESLLRFAYNPSAGRCEAFTYSGCQGNANNFETHQECEARCTGSRTDQTGRSPSISQQDPCANVRCGYNAHCISGYCYCNQGYEGDASRECKPFSTDPCANVRCGQNAYCASGYCYCNQGYEGDPNRECQAVSSAEFCNGNRCTENARCVNGQCKCNEGYYGDPLQFCQFIAGDKPSSNPRCRLPIDAGQCFERLVSYGYDSRTGRCEQFFYTGCMGNENRFKTYGECERECGIVPIKDPCEGVRCGYNAKCVEGRCICQPGFKGDPDYECRSDKTDKCHGVLCGYNAHCQDGYCVCEPSHSGDPYRDCRPDAQNPCEIVKCAHFAVCANGTCICLPGTIGDPYKDCIPDDSDACQSIRCGYNSKCVNGRCECESGYEGDPYYECRLDRCRGVVCGQNAQCIDGRCECLPGYEGDPQRECRTGENCRGQRCGENAYCRDEVCICETGYQGNPYTGCVQINDRCDGVQCAINAFCENGYCRCNPGYGGDGFLSCYYQGNCANVQCGANAHCIDGRCVCVPGYTGDPDRRCYPADDQDTCNGRRCGQNAVCDRDLCICKMGYEGDPFYGCTEIPPKPEFCGNTYCHPNARCHNGVCFCEYGYVGDGVTVCEKIEEDLCKRVRCTENAECEAGLCQCKPGFKGDGFSECTPLEVDPDSCNGRYCGANAQCQDGRCVCVSGYDGNPYDICTRERPLPDNCHGIECGSNAYCQNGICVCYEGFEGEPTLACKPIYDPSCIGIRCGVNAYCTNGRCQCRQSHVGNPTQICYPDWGSSGSSDLCANLACHANATCSEGQCRCNYGFEGDGFIDCWPKDPANLCDCRGMPSSMAGCSNGKCRCMSGFNMGRDNYCEECRGHGECAANAQCTYDRQIQHYRCICDIGYIGDGAIACIPGTVANRTEQAQCRIPCHRFASCDEHDGRCKCRPGFIGNGYTYCDFDCDQCLAEARCMPESNQCVCPPGYTGDGIRICRPTASQNIFSLKIAKDSETIRMREGSGALTLRCILSGDVRNAQARWLTPGDIGRTNEQVTQEGLELWLTIDQPSAEHSGLYVCQASRVSDTVNVIVEPGQHAQTKRLFLSSDNGILTVQTQGEPTVAAQIWHIAENNRHERVAIALDCKSDRLIYTSDFGRAIRFGNASTARLNQPPELIYQDNLAKFTWVAVDSVSGNVFAIDDGQGRIIVVNPERPNHVHTLKKFANRSLDVGFATGGIAVHPSLSLVYWAQLEDGDPENRESVIKVVSMADPERVSELTRVDGAPIAISLAVTDDMTGSGSTAGRLCWLQRRQLVPYSRTEIYCAQLDSVGRSIHSKRLLKVFDANEEPSCGLIQDDYTILWTSLYRKTYRSLNPSSSVYVKGVCCSNGFQSIAIYSTCKRSMTNTCSYENGRCRYFCLPGGREMSRICRCPDDQPNCVAEYT